MAKWVTLAELALRARRRVDLVGATHISDTEVDDYVKESACELYDLIIRHFGNDYFYQKEDTYTVSGTDTVALPNDFYKLIAVDFHDKVTVITLTGPPPGYVSTTTVTQVGRPIPLRPFTWDERADEYDTGGWTEACPPRYRLRDEKLWFSRPPLARHGIRFHYIPTCPILEDAGDGIGSGVDFQGVDGWEEYIVLDTAIKIATKDETIAIDPLSAALQKAAARVKASAPNRDSREPPMVRRTRGRVRYR